MKLPRPRKHRAAEAEAEARAARAEARTRDLEKQLAATDVLRRLDTDRHQRMADRIIRLERELAERPPAPKTLVADLRLEIASLQRQLATTQRQLDDATGTGDTGLPARPKDPTP